MQPGLYRRNRHLKGSRCLSSGALLEIMKNQNLAVLCGKANNSSTNRLDIFDPRQRLERRFNGRGECVEIAEWLTGWSVALPAIGLQNLVDRDAGDPSAKAGLRAKGREMKPDLKHHLLKDVIEVRDVPHHRADTSFHRRQVAVHKCRETFWPAGEG